MIALRGVRNGQIHAVALSQHGPSTQATHKHLTPIV